MTIADTDRARDLLTAHARLSARDAVHVAVMVNSGISRVATFDQAFDVVPSIERVAMR